MIRIPGRTITLVAVMVVGLALSTGNAIAQTAKDLVGTWSWVSIDGTRPDGSKFQPMGPNPKGSLIFESNGRFAYVLIRSGIPKFAANKRDQGTPEENKAAVEGSLVYSGRYRVEGSRTATLLIFSIEASTYPNADGTEQSRSITLTGDELKWTNPALTVGGSAETVLKRVK